MVRGSDSGPALEGETLRSGAGREWFSEHIDSIYQEAYEPIPNANHGAGIFTNMYPKNHSNVSKYTIHGAYGYERFQPTRR
jgi:hypothetical protein